MANGNGDGSNGNSLEFPTPWGGLKAKGRDLIIVIIILAGAIFSGYLAHSHGVQSASDHQHLNEWFRYTNCRISLDIWVHTRPEPASIRLSQLPYELAECLPAYLIREHNERDTTKGKK